jgi:hypothetical protein
MDPITTALVAALVAGVTQGATNVGKQTLVDAYNGLKTLLKKKFGVEGEIIKSVERLEAKPESVGRQETLKEDIAGVNADQDPELLQAAQVLLDQVRAQPQGASIIQNVTGNYNAVSYSGDSTVNVNQSKEP